MGDKGGMGERVVGCREGEWGRNVKGWFYDHVKSILGKKRDDSDDFGA